ncbi:MULTISPECIES: polysaccharide biosynthesis/export family protein [unclassified Kaistella]|uniref:polysaccharide biosynthesis/export family protein n=1 Tax=unclassified Kaistella TaxID=2762626 RepID=UPI00273483C9|nr:MULTISPECIES: polysaccharide biosynthesis/export family protein [unclassified Kaistella]MDP2454879.1 polysaccharide biosynthesis/export family protein [Kaistella sp. SH11-4b]MDP2457616.1 polysaccharide biosynthesis/export family protein [Kaistella sp. SH40-3]MDP2460376.1 polysaccharide biosynthesis/export family protein [Kaistella sp. SH19-2b]
MKKIKNIFLVSTLILTAFSCKPKENMVYMENQTTAIDQEVKQAVFLGTHLQSGDLLDIKVTAFDDNAVRPFNLHSMNQAGEITGIQQNQNPQNFPQGYLVSNEGYIIFPVLGKIFVQNMTMSELREDLEKRLLEYLTDPMVSIRQLNFNITVLGEVKKPGQYTSPSDKVTILQALGMAGDMTDNGDRTKVKLVRHENGSDQTYVIYFTDKNITSSPYYYMQQNDVLYVEPDENKKIIAGTNPNRNLIFSIIGSAVAITSILISTLK